MLETEMPRCFSSRSTSVCSSLRCTQMTICLLNLPSITAPKTSSSIFALRSPSVARFSRSPPHRRRDIHQQLALPSIVRLVECARVVARNAMPMHLGRQVIAQVAVPQVAGPIEEEPQLARSPPHAAVASGCPPCLDPA